MSAPGLTSSAQVRYLLQWFGEFSELQREDFLPVLSAAQREKNDELASALEALTCDDKPVSLFQCRLKLFNEWYPTWPKEDQDRLMTGISNMDQEFARKLQEFVPKVNGENGMNGFHTAESSDEEYLRGKSDDTVGPESANIPENGDANETNLTDNIPLEIAAAS